MKKLIALFLVLALSVCMFTACASKAGEPAKEATTEAPAAEETAPAAEETKEEAPATEEAKEITIGVSLQNLSEDFMIMLQGAMENKVKEYDNVKLVFNDAESDSAKQTSQLESFIAQGVDAVILSPVDADAMAPAVKEVVDAGIPCITCSADVTGDMGQVWVGSENADGGATEAQYVADQLGGKGNVAVLRGPLGAFAEQGRFQGYEEVFNQYPDIQIVFDQTANWQRDEAMALVENWLTTGTEINAICCQNDGMALGAYEAVKAAGKQDEIIITGIDAIEDALNSIKAGEMAATCFQDAIGQGEGALEMAIKAVNGEHIEYTNIPFELVTIDNVDSYYDRIKLPG